jgi:hypothetical protein
MVRAAHGSRSFARRRDLHIAVPSVAHFKGRRIFRLHLAPIINPGCCNVGVPQPFLDFGNVGVVVKRIGGGGGAQRMGADLESQSASITADEFVDTVRGDGVVELAGTVVADGSNSAPSVSAA